jgi:hypothetical protein
MNEKVFENLLRIANDKFGLTRKKDIADKIGATSQKMTNWKNRGVPTSEYLNIATRLGISVDELLGRISTTHATSYETTTPVSASHATGYEGENDSQPCNMMELDKYEQALIELIKDQSADQKAMLLDIAKTLTKAK